MLRQSAGLGRIAGSIRRTIRVSGRVLRSHLHTSGRVTERDERRTMSDEWGKTPRDLHHHLSQYCIGQSLAKKILSVAVFNHYSRITPLLHPPTPPPSPSYPHNLSHSLDVSSSSPSSSSGANPTQSALPPDPSSPTAQQHVLPSTLSVPIKRRGRPPKIDLQSQGQTVPDPTDGQQEPDPTLIHDPLGGTERVEGIGAWDGIGRGFYSRAPPPSPPSLLARVRGALSTVSSTTPPASHIISLSTKQTPPNPEEDLSPNADRYHPRIESDEALDHVIIEKSNVLLLGPTGSGKSLLAKTLARVLDVPFASSDATSFTQAGYVGDDVESCVLRLLKAADYDVARTEVGIIHIDECDKLARRGGGGGSDGGSWGGRDVAGEGVQQALLKLLEGTTLTLQAKPPPQAAAPPSSLPGGPLGYSSSFDHTDPIQRGIGGSSADFGPKKGVREGLPSHGGGGGGSGGAGGKGETFTVDTSNILFILSGSFVGLEKLIQRRIGKGSMGFNAVLPTPQKGSDHEDEVSDDPAQTHEGRRSRLEGLTTGDLIEYGFIPEFVGRLPILAPLHPLSLSDLVRVLTEPNNALIKQYRKIFLQHGCELRFSNSALSAIAGAAAKKGGSARHLRGALEDILLDSMYEIPGSSVRFTAITASVVRKEIPALYFSRGQRETFYQTLSDDDKPEVAESFGFEEEQEERMTAVG